MRRKPRSISRPEWSVKPSVVSFDDRIGQDLLAALARDVATIMELGHQYKRCRARWVVKIDWPTGPVVVKLFTERSPRHALKQRVLRSRARRAADQAFRFAELGFRTPMPLAMLQEQFGPFRGNSCLVYEYVDGRTLADGPGPMIQPLAQSAGKTSLEYILGKMHQTRDQLIELGLAHHDCHGGNFMLDRCGDMYLLDIDSIRPALLRNKNAARLRFLFSLIEKGVAGRMTLGAA